jgi:glycosyltransferase involved in cell wall biosynthesis
MRTVLFFRDSRRFRGHDLKLWHYFNHVLSSPDHTPYVEVFGEDGWDEGNPWSEAHERTVRGGMDLEPDVLFLSGIDWQHVEPAHRARSPIPVINLIQHVKHACPDDPLGRYAFLSHRAIRICVSPSVQSALESTERVCGPIFTIPNCIDLDDLGASAGAGKDIDLLIAANKAPELGRALAGRLASPDRVVRLVDSWIGRSEFLELVGRSRVGIFLPLEKEGFYLPPLEAMALRTAVVCPDCIGNRAYCRPNRNCLRPEYTEEEIAGAAELLLRDPPRVAEMVEQGESTAREHDLRRERASFLEILTRADELWDGDGP